MLPVEPASASVWQPAHPADPRNTSLPATGSPCPSVVSVVPVPVSVVSVVSVGVVSVGVVSVGVVSVGVVSVGVVSVAFHRRFLVLAELGEEQHGGHLREEEPDADRDEHTKALGRKVGSCPRHDKSEDERGDNEHRRDYEQPQLVTGQRQRHSGGRYHALRRGEFRYCSSGAIVKPKATSWLQ